MTRPTTAALTCGGHGWRSGTGFPEHILGPKALAVAADVGDGWMTTSPDADMLDQYRTSGGTAPEADARKLAYELWPTSGVPGQLSQDLPTAITGPDQEGFLDFYERELSGRLGT